MRTDIEQAIREHYPMPSDVRKHSSAANHDLYFGPLGADHWREETGDDSAPDYDWVESAKVFWDWIESLDTIYVEEDSGCAMTSEPECDLIDPETGEPTDDEEIGEWVEPMPYYQISPSDIADAFGYRELWNHR